MNTVIEKLSAQELVREWEAELEILKSMDASNPGWDWKPVQERLERLHALAHEIHGKKAQERAKWQP